MKTRVPRWTDKVDIDIHPGIGNTDARVTASTVIGSERLSTSHIVGSLHHIPEAIEWCLEELAVAVGRYVIKGTKR